VRVLSLKRKKRFGVRLVGYAISWKSAVVKLVADAIPVIVRKFVTVKSFAANVVLEAPAVEETSAR
jgi:hypothetical protein